eukprot:442177_1
MSIKEFGNHGPYCKCTNCLIIRIENTTYNLQQYLLQFKQNVHHLTVPTNQNTSSANSYPIDTNNNNNNNMGYGATNDDHTLLVGSCGSVNMDNHLFWNGSNPYPINTNNNNNDMGFGVFNNNHALFSTVDQVNLQMDIDSIGAVNIDNQLISNIASPYPIYTNNINNNNGFGVFNNDNSSVFSGGLGL